MQLEELVHAGRLDEALAFLEGQVRKEPANPAYRVSLFQLLSVLGDWPRALTHLNVAGQMEAGNLLTVHMYRPALQAEALREEIFSAAKSPLVFAEPAEWIAHLIQAGQMVAQEKYKPAAVLRDRAFEAAPAVPGHINGRPFQWIADADCRLGPMLEAIIDGKYYWVPFTAIRKLVIEEPTDLRDMVWTCAHFVWRNEGQSFGLIPTRYPGSEHSSDSAIRLARRTEWLDRPGGYYLGLGQRMLTTDTEEVSLLDVRTIDMAPGRSEADEGGPDG